MVFSYWIIKSLSQKKGVLVPPGDSVDDLPNLSVGGRLLLLMEELGFTEEIQGTLLTRPDILRDFLGYYRIVFGGPPREETVPPILLQDIERLEFTLSTRLRNALRDSGVTKVFDLVSLDKASLLRLRHVGRRSEVEIIHFLTRNGLNLSMKFEMKGRVPVRVIDAGIPIMPG